MMPTFPYAITGNAKAAGRADANPRQSNQRITSNQREDFETYGQYGV